MFSTIKAGLGAVSVTEANNVITVEGVSFRQISADIQRLWGTSRIVKNMIRKLGNYKMRFDSFYAIEVFYVLKRLREYNKSLLRNRIIDATLKGLVENTWLANTQKDKPDVSKIDWSQLKQFTKKKPLDQQIDFINRYDLVTQLYGLNGYMLASPAGTGKTLSSLFLMHCIKGVDAIVVLTPNNALHLVWENTIKEEIKNHGKIWLSDSGKPVDPDAKYFLVHYEGDGLKNFFAQVNMLKGRNIAIIVDESHNFNESNSNRTQMLIDLCHTTQSKDILWQSGTPFKAKATELLPFAECIDPLMNKRVKASFGKIFGISVSRAADMLSYRIGRYSFTVEKAEIVEGEPIEETVKIKIPNSNDYTLDAVKNKMAAYIDKQMAFYKEHFDEYKKTYDDELKAFEDTLKSTSDKQAFEEYKKSFKIVVRQQGAQLHLIKSHVLYCNKYEKFTIAPTIPDKVRRDDFKAAKSVVKYVTLKVRGECLGLVLGKLREQVQIDMAAHTPFNEYIDAAKAKTLIFTDFVKVVDAIHDKLTKLKYKPVRIYGRTNKELPQMIGKLGSRPGINPAIAVYKSLSTAVPMTMANCLILTNSPFREYIRIQAISRAFRKGQKNQVYVIDTVLDTGDVPNISTHAKDIMSFYKEQVNMLLGLSNDEIAEEAYAYEAFDGDNGYVDHSDILPPTAYWNRLKPITDPAFEDYYATDSHADIPFDMPM